MTTPRRRWSFGLRTLFVAVTVMAAITGMARVSPGLLAAALVCGPLSLGSLALADRIATRDNYGQCDLSAYCFFIIRLALVMVGLCLMTGCFRAAVGMILTVIGDRS